MGACRARLRILMEFITWLTSHFAECSQWLLHSLDLVIGITIEDLYGTTLYQAWCRSCLSRLQGRDAPALGLVRPLPDRQRLENTIKSLRRRQEITTTGPQHFYLIQLIYPPIEAPWFSLFTEAPLLPAQSA